MVVGVVEGWKQREEYNREESEGRVRGEREGKTEIKQREKRSREPG